MTKPSISTQSPVMKAICNYTCTSNWNFVFTFLDGNRNELGLFVLWFFSDENASLCWRLVFILHHAILTKQAVCSANTVKTTCKHWSRNEVDQTNLCAIREWTTSTRSQALHLPTRSTLQKVSNRAPCKETFRLGGRRLKGNKMRTSELNMESNISFIPFPPIFWLLKQKSIP